MAQTRLKSGNLHMVGGDNGTSGNVLKSKGDGTMEWGVAINPPGFSSFDYPGNDTALDPAGGQSLVINGSGFNSGVTVTIGGTTPSSITLNSATQITVTTPAKSAGSQALVITNTDGGSASASVSYNGIPAFTNAAGSLASVRSGATINVSAAATEPDGGAITYAITSGSLPSGISLNTSTGAITGTAPSVDASTTSNFTVTATDNENQSTARAYSITVTPPLPSDKFKVVTYTGNGSTQSITGVGFKPDLVWVKVRSTTGSGPLADSSRGTRKAMYSNLDSADYTFPAGQGVTSFDADGFSIGDNSTGNGGYNGNGKTYVAWCWKANGGTTSSNSDGTITSTVQANQDAGFSIVTYTGTGANATVGHGLGAQPYVVITKGRDSVVGTTNWRVYTNALGGTKNLKLNGNDAAATGNSTWNDTDPTSSVFSLGTSGDPNGNNATYVAYCFAPVAGFSKFGSYTGNGSANGPIVETGFEPAFLIVKSTTGSGWDIWDNKRNTTNPRNTILTTNNNAADYTSTSIVGIDFLSNGFQIKNTNADHNANGNKYIYMAFAADPDTEAPTLASSFNIETYTGTGADRSITGLGFSPNFVWAKRRSATEDNVIFDSLRGVQKQLSTNKTNAESTKTNAISSYDSDGFTTGANNALNTSGEDYVAWTFKTDNNEPTIFSPSQTVGGIKSTNLTLNLNLAGGSYSGSGTDLTDLSSAGETFSRSSAGNIKEGFGGYYIDLEGNDQYWTSDTSVATTTGNDITIEFWIRSESASQNSYANIIDANHGTAVAGSSGQGWVIQMRGSNYNSYYFAYYDGSTYQSNSDSELFTLTNNEWTHIAIVKSGTSVQAYKNGVAGNSWTAGNATLQYPNQKVKLGQWISSDSRGFNGSFAQVRFYSDALSSSEVTTNYNATKELFTTIESIVSANANAGFSIVKYEGDGNSGTKIPHGLSAAPEMVISKSLDSTNGWNVYHTSLSTNYMIKLNSTSAAFDATAGTKGGGITVDATTMTILAGASNQDNNNKSGDNFIAYCFHDVAGYQKFGSYTGSGTTNSITGLGFKPDWLMIKRATGGSSNGWVICDSKRGVGVNLRADTDGAEADESAYTTSFDSDGFTLEQAGGNTNVSGSTYIYWAVAKNVPSNTTLADSFKILTYTGNGGTQSITGLGFSPDLVWIKNRTSSGQDHILHDSIRGAGQNFNIYSANTAAQGQYGQYGYLSSFGTDGFTVVDGQGEHANTSSKNYVAWTWKAGNTWQSNIDGTIPSITNTNTANGLSIVKYTGTGSTGTYGHGLSSSPNCIITKRLDATEGWLVWFSSLPASNYMYLNSNGMKGTDTNAYKTIGSTTNQIGSDGTVNTSGGEYISYCWHAVSGYSAFGTYAGNGTSQSINIGFKPDLLILRKYDDNQDWMIWDSVRDGNPKSARLEANNSDAEVGGTTNINFISTGFEFTSGSYNDSGQNSVYMAFKMNPTPMPLTGNMSFLVIAGGGSGGRTNAGGAGAGGLRTSYGSTSGGGASAESDITLAAGTYTITIGAGGAALTSNGVGNNGVDSSIAASGLTTITSVGGGGGFGSGSGASSAGSGGSGGGAGTNQSNAASGFGSGTANQGFDGGARFATVNTYAGGGGGGASQAGQASTGLETGGAGGAGLAVEITGSSVTYAGGGGGGGGYNGGAAGAAGAGGGTAGGYINDAVSNATANTGGGSGGTRNAVTAGSGGSGVVILRLLTSEYSSSVTGSPTVTTDGDYTILKYTGSGTYVHS